jgi:hypothetical protein
LTFVIAPFGRGTRASTWSCNANSGDAFVVSASIPIITCHGFIAGKRTSSLRIAAIFCTRIVVITGFWSRRATSVDTFVDRASISIFTCQAVVFGLQASVRGIAAIGCARIVIVTISRSCNATSGDTFFDRAKPLSILTCQAVIVDIQTSIRRIAAIFCTRVFVITGFWSRNATSGDTFVDRTSISIIACQVVVFHMHTSFRRMAGVGCARVVVIT